MDAKENKMLTDIPNQRTLSFLLDNDRILLGLKMRGMGSGNYNGFGGSFKEGESSKEAAVREIFEETGGVIVKQENLDERGTIDFNFPWKPEWNQKVHIYLVRRWGGEPRKTLEMEPKWFDRNKLPWDKMWESDKYWLPQVLEGIKIEAKCVWAKDNKTVETFSIQQVSLY